MSETIDSASLLARAGELIDRAVQAGADAADAVVVRGRSSSVSVRLGKVEGTEASESDDFSLRVFVGRRVASVSANPGFDLKVLAERAVAMAKASPEDPYATLAGEADLARDWPDLELFDPTVVSSEQLTEAEVSIRCADIYLWLSQRPPFARSGPDAAEVRTARAAATREVDAALQRKIDTTRRCRNCGRPLSPNHRFNLCTDCYRDPWRAG